MTLTGKTVLVTGANRGIGAAIVEALLAHNVKKIYAAVRDPAKLGAHQDPRIVPITLDIGKQDQITAAANTAKDVDVLINNAGVATFEEIFDSTPETLRQQMDINYYGTVNMMKAFTPALAREKSGVIVNIISVVGLSAVPALGGYSASKAALLSATQSARATLLDKGIRVVSVFPGPIDTEMAREIPMDKATPQSAAREIVDGIDVGAEDIFPDPMSKQVAAQWRQGPKELEAMFANRRAEQA